MPNWTIVTTVSAPSWMIVLHARYHSSLGAQTPIYFLDAPQNYSPEEKELLSKYAKIVLCDEPYWDGLGGRPAQPTRRQIVNIQVARKIHDSAWVLHIDIDEFLHLDMPDINYIFDLPPEISEIRIENVERVLAFEKKVWTDGYLRVRAPQPEILARHYGAKARFFGLGMSHYFHGKSLVKNRRRIRQNIHGAIHSDPDKEIIRYELNRKEAVIVHYPCITPSHFASRYLSFLRHGRNDTAEFLHQRLFRSHLVSEARRLGARSAIIQCLKDLHYCSAQQALDRLKDGLYEQVPARFLARLADCVLEDQNINLAWADKSFSQYHGLASR